ncbi:MAG: histidine phosphatase family protein [Bacteroidales bacterium]
MDIYLVRHGQTEWDEERRMQGSENSGMTAMGKEESKYLAKELSRTEFSKIYSSPLGRAMETAKYLKMGRNQEIIPIEAFREMDLGELEGMADRDVKAKYPEEHYNFWNRPHIFKPAGGETFEELRKRVEKGLEDLIEKAEGDRILVVTHTLVIRMILCIVHNYPLDDFWKTTFLKSSSLTVLRVDDEGKIESAVEGDISHLD